MYKIEKNKSKNLENLLKNDKSFEKFIDKDYKKVIKDLQDEYSQNSNQIIFNQEIKIKTNGIFLFENKREFPSQLDKEVNPFLSHSFYFINIFKKINILLKNSDIHLIFVYDHSRCYTDKDKAYKSLVKFIENNKERLKENSNTIIFHLIHSSPNLQVSIL